MVFRFAEDAERYCDSDSESNAKAVRRLFDAGDAAYATEAATFSIVERFDTKPYVKIDCETLTFQGYISGRVADSMRWKFVPETEYRAQDWISAAFYAWTGDDLTHADVLFQQAAIASGATPAQVAKALLLRAAIVEALGRPDEALTLLNEITDRFGNHSDADVRAYVAEAMCDKGGLSGRKGQYSKALAAYDAAILRFGRDRNEKLRAQIAVALLQKGVAFCELGRFEKAVELNQKLLASFEETSSPPVQRDIALGYRNMAAALYRLHKFEEAIKTTENLVAKFSTTTDPRNIIQVAWGLHFRGLVLQKLDRHEDACLAYEELIRRFGTSRDRDIQKFVERATKQLNIRTAQSDGAER
jgi:tetratricopeptide (TPR) repeat protein